MSFFESFLFFFRCIAMAKRASKEKVAKGKKAASKEKSEKKDRKKGAKFIPKHLAPCSNEDVCPFYLNKGKDEMSQLKLKNTLGSNWVISSLPLFCAMVRHEVGCFFFGGATGNKLMARILSFGKCRFGF